MRFMGSLLAWFSMMSEMRGHLVSVALRGTRDESKEQLTALRQQATELEAEVEALRSEPSPKEALERKKSILEEDVSNFYEIIENPDEYEETAESLVGEREGIGGQEGREEEYLKKRVE